MNKRLVFSLGVAGVTLLCSCKPTYHAETALSDTLPSATPQAAPANPHTLAGGGATGDAAIARNTPPPPVAAAPTPHHYAPPGIFFLTKPYSVASDIGVTSLRPGTKVVKMADGSYFAGGDQLPHLNPEQLTNDIDLAEQLSHADAAAGEAIQRAQSSAAQRVESESHPNRSPKAAY